MTASFKFIVRSIRSYINSISIILLLICVITAYSQQDSIQFDGQGINDIKCSVTLTLQKTDYKLFEPVIVKAEVINQSKIAYDIHDLFSADYGGVGNFNITNDSGKIWNRFIEYGDLIYIAAPVYLIQPGDTFITSASLNDYGSERSSYDFYFNQLGYFPVGKNYTVYYSDKNIRSNEVHFNIADLNDEDSNVIKIYGYFHGLITLDSAYSWIISNYPDNSLVEHILVQKLKIKYNSRFHKNLDLIGLEEDYQSFFKKYPNSYCMYDEYFMCFYYARLFSGFFVPYGKIIKEIEGSNVSVQLNDYLNKRNTINRIKYIVKRLDDDLNWKTKRKNSIIIPNPEYWRY